MADTIERTPATDEKLVADILRGAIDLHCHSGPSVMPRRLDHIEAIEQGIAAGLRAILFKDHYYSVTPVVDLLGKRYASKGIRLLSGIALNNPVGGLNRYAVDHAIKLGANIVWMPTFSSANHLNHHAHDKDFDKKFPTTKEKMLAPTPLGVLGADGKLLDEAKFILDLVAEADLVLSSGHLHISEIWPLFEEAKARGVKRLLCNHPTYVVDATLEDVRSLVSMGVYVEHSMCMFIEGSKFKFYDGDNLKKLIEMGTIERTILGSDLGQVGNPTPVEGFKAGIRLCLGLGYQPDEIRRMISGNAAQLFSLPAAVSA
jgi:hypothetical protein